MFRGGVTDHISSCSAVNSDKYNTVTMKYIHIRRSTGGDTVGNNVRGRQSGLRTRWIRIKVVVRVLFVVQYSDDLSRLYHEVPVIVRGEGTLTEEVVCVRATGLLGQGTDLVSSIRSHVGAQNEGTPRDIEGYFDEVEISISQLANLFPTKAR